MAGRISFPPPILGDFAVNDVDKTWEF